MDVTRSLLAIALATSSFLTGPHPVLAEASKASAAEIDLSIQDVTLSRYDFRRGDMVTIKAVVDRGTLAIPVRVRGYIDTGNVNQVASTETILDNVAEFQWTASYDAGDSEILVGAYVEPLAGETDLDNNGLWRHYHSHDEGDDGDPGNPALHYAVKTHKHLTEQAILLTNIPEITQFADRIVYGAQKEDSFPDLVYGVSWFFGLSSLWTRHFWDVDKGEQGRGLLGRESALQKGRAYLYGWPNHPGAIELYQQGNKALAYEYLGRAAHFVEDVSTPAHVHLDAHAIDDEEAEKWGKKHGHEYTFDQVEAPFDGDSFYDIIHHAAQLADSLPSDDVEGNTVGFTDPGGWTPLLKRKDIISWNWLGWDKAKPEGMKQVFARTMPSAMAHASGLFRFFWKQTHPGEELPAPATGNVEPKPPLSLRN